MSMQVFHHKKAVLLGISIVLASALPAFAGKGGPKIEIPEPEHNFGSIPNDRAVEHVFKEKNAGDRPLVITAVRTSCGCTAAMMESSVIEPGGNGNLRVSFHPKGGKNTVTRTVTVSSNDPGKPDVQIRVSASPVPAAEIDAPVVPVKRTHEKRGRLSFDGGCARCHVPQKAGLSGKKLYLAACASCHGQVGQGVILGSDIIGPALKAGGTAVRTNEGLNLTITAGTGHPWMPGFGAEYGGPLSEKQVDSLVKLIRNNFKEK